MERAILIGSPPVTVTLRRSDRARRFLLRVSRVDGRVTLSVPKGAPEAEAVRFAAAQEGWIRRALAQSPVRQGLALGGTLPFAGQVLRIEAGTVRAVQVQGAVMLVPQAARAEPGPRIEAFVKLAARHRLQAACDHYAGLVGRAHAGITLRDTRSRWGSCASSGKLMFSWRLMLAPPEVLDYVAAHEVAHLVQMNHSPAFWAVVRRLMPDYLRHRTWLRTHGAVLQAIRFRGPGGD